MRGTEFQNTQANARLIAIAGAKGGVGRSTCAAALGRALVIREHRVLLVEFCTLGSTLSAMLDMDEPPIQASFPVAPVASPLPGLDLVCLSVDVLRSIAQADHDFLELCRQMHQLGYDDVILDLHAGFDDWIYRFFASADLPILIADPEPSCLKLTLKWLENSVLSFVRSKMPEFISASSWDFNKIYAQISVFQQQELVSLLKQFKCAFLLNHRREQSEHLQTAALCHAFGMIFGVDIHALGSLSADDRRWFYARGMADVSLFEREDPLVRELEVILREKLPSFKDATCLPMLDAKQNAREFLRVKTSHEARSAYRQLWEGYKREHGLVSAVMSRTMIAQTIQKLEMAHRNAEMETTALNDHSGGISQLGNHQSSTDLGPLRSSCMARIGGKISPSDCNRDAGLWLRNQRLERGLTLSQLAMKTRIPVRVLENIEALSFEPMAASRFSAYLFEIARGLGILADALKHRFGVS